MSYQGLEAEIKELREAVEVLSFDLFYNKLSESELAHARTELADILPRVWELSV